MTISQLKYKYIGIGITYTLKYKLNRLANQNTMPTIEVNHLTKEYQLGHIASLKETALNTLRRMTFQETQERERFKALDDINFHINEGEVVGIIGHNGAGKSTLLKHLANISKPTTGEVIVRGSVAPLIEVGAGVNPELTGRENIFLNGAILGIPKKIIQQKLDEIIDFSELEQFIDTPVKRYSSGMTIKLGFSIATSMDADILIIDEVLAVGDLAFQRKCFDRMEDIIQRQGKTVLLVSHNIRQVERLCTRTLLLNKGQVVADGNATEVCDLFYQRSNKQIQDNQIINNSVQSTGEFVLQDISIQKGNSQEKTFSSGDDLQIKVKFELTTDFERLNIFIGTHRTDFIYLTYGETFKYFPEKKYPKGQYELEYFIPNYPLTAGTFSVRIAVQEPNGRFLFNGESLKSFSIQANSGEELNSKWKMLELNTKMTISNL